MKTIPFYTDDIAIKVHSSTYKPFVSTVLTLAEFEKTCAGSRFSLRECGNGDLLYVCKDSGDFIEGEQQ